MFVSDWPAVQQFSAKGSLLRQWDLQGTESGMFQHPYGLAVDRDGNVFLADTGNHRVQTLTRTSP